MVATKREEALTTYYKTLAKKHAEIDQKLLRALDYETKAGIMKLRNDPRPLARVDSGKVITVANFIEELDKQFYHGVEDAAGQKQLNQKGRVVFDSMLFRVLLLDEAERQNLRATEAFKRPAREATDKILFGAFMQNAILPTIQVTETEGKKYYEEHKKDYTTPAMVRLDGLAFSQVKEAQTAIQKLKAGTDFKWMAQNADGLVPSDKQTFQFAAGPVTVDSMPDGLLKAIAGAKEGEYRLWDGPGGQAYVVRILKEVPPSVQPFADVQEGIQKKLFGEKIAPVVKQWADKLRQHHDVRIYVSTWEVVTEPAFRES